MERGGRWEFIGGLGWRPEGRRREIGKEGIPSSMDGRFLSQVGERRKKKISWAKFGKCLMGHLEFS